MILSQELRPSKTFELDGQIFTVLNYHHNKQARGGAIIKVKIRNILTGSITEKTFRSGEKLKIARIESRPMQYLYHDGHNYIFMDQESFEQIGINDETLGDSINFLIEGNIINVNFYKDSPIGVDLPISMELKISKTDPGLRGDTVSGATKPATTETGLTINVPLFINEGDIIKIDTRTSEYIERV
jgi:elongation factor P